MKLKPHGAQLVDFVISYADEEISRWAFDLDYSGYVIEHFPAFQREHPRLAKRFADTIDFTYSNCSLHTAVASGSKCAANGSSAVSAATEIIS